jgi:hypothetical protein
LHLAASRDPGGTELRVALERRETNIHNLWNADIVGIRNGENIAGVSRARLLRHPVVLRQGSELAERVISDRPSGNLLPEEQCETVRAVNLAREHLAMALEKLGSS